MPRPTRQHPESGTARTRLLDAARDTIRRSGYATTSVDELCQAAAVTKGAFFHHFKSKEALGVAAARHWAETTSALFADAPYHDHDDPLKFRDRKRYTDRLKEARRATGAEDAMLVAEGEIAQLETILNRLIATLEARDEHDESLFMERTKPE